MAAGRVLLHGGYLYDGMSPEIRRADVLVSGSRIEAVGRGTADSIDARDASVFDVTGLLVAPGFIDLHAHSDLIATLPPPERRRLQRGKIFQGITTEIAGNCGLAPAPLTPQSREAVLAVLTWMSPPGSDMAWDGFDSYLDRIERSQPLPLNTGFLAAHGPIRAAVLGMGRSRAGPDAHARMADLVRAALDAGAFGLSTGLIYPPGLYADTDELAACAAPLARAGALYTSHVRGSSETLLPAVDELLDIGRRTGARVHHSHSEAVGQLIFGITGEDGHDAPVVQLLRDPHGAIATDACDYGTGLPHPAAYGAFPRILARYVRERGVLALAEALRRMTSLPATIAGMSDRGVLRPGAAADIVVLDPRTVEDRARFEEPRREATGLRHVLVNGILAAKDGALTDTDGGRVLRHV